MEAELDRRPSQIMEERLRASKIQQEEENDTSGGKSSSTFWVPINGGMQGAIQKRWKTWDQPKDPETTLARRKSMTKSKSVGGVSEIISPSNKTEETDDRTTVKMRRKVTKSHSFSAQGNSSSRTIQRASGTWDLATSQGLGRLSDASSTTSRSSLASTVSAPTRTKQKTQVRSNELMINQQIFGECFRFRLTLVLRRGA